MPARYPEYAWEKDTVEGEEGEEEPEEEAESEGDDEI